MTVPGNYYIYNIDQNISSSEANAKIILGSLYILFGMGLIGMCVNLMQEKIFLKVRKQFNKVLNYDNCSFEDKTNWTEPRANDKLRHK